MTNTGPHRPGASVILPIVALLGAGGAALAEEDGWSLDIEPVYVRVYGHDQHVLTIHERDLDVTPTVDDKTAVDLETDAGFAYRLRYHRQRGRWGWGAGYFLLLTSQNTGERTAAADGAGGPIEEIAFEVADRSFTSTGPGEVLFYEVLEDTDLEVWTFDLFGTRALAESPDGGVHLIFGVRLGDFDNDYRAVVGIQGTGGSRLDASSNYPLMMGPLVGLAGSFRGGRSVFEGSIGQSVLLGRAELDGMSREFTGTFGPSPSYVAREGFNEERDVAIPITELRFRWTCRVSEHIAVGAGVDTSLWWDVPVPPGVIPIADGDEVLHENTIVFFGLTGVLKLTF